MGSGNLDALKCQLLVVKQQSEGRAKIQRAPVATKMMAHRNEFR